MQSRELRIIALKWLEELKRAGRLPGVLLRKTLLEECAGARYEELLVAVSTLVLRVWVERGAFQGVRESVGGLFVSLFRLCVMADAGG